MSPATTRVPWSRDQLVVVCGLYFTLPFGRMHARNPTIKEMARLLGRSPSSIAMKLVNFASLDPSQRARGIKGLGNHTRADEQVWNEFESNWDQMSLASEEKLQELQTAAAHFARVAESIFPKLLNIPEGVITEVEMTVKVRTMQTFFRKVVLAAYSSTCCITGNPVEDLLVASHIMPWNAFPKERLNPRNGLCLAAHFDRAFDRGLITFDERLRLMLSPRIRSHLPNNSLESEFVSREGLPLIFPDRFAPEQDFIAHHRIHIFRAA